MAESKKNKQLILALSSPQPSHGTQIYLKMAWWHNNMYYILFKAITSLHAVAGNSGAAVVHLS